MDGCVRKRSIEWTMHDSCQTLDGVFLFQFRIDYCVLESVYVFEIYTRPTVILFCYLAL